MRSLIEQVAGSISSGGDPFYACLGYFLDNDLPRPAANCQNAKKTLAPENVSCVE